MKKIKLLTPILCLTGLTSIAPALVLASCGPDKTKGIDIKTNDNIKIECKTINVGEPLIIKYSVDTNFGFDLINSTITFKDSNGVVLLIQCEINKKDKTITVPGNLVTSKEVVIDIKAESNSAIDIKQEDYTKAINLLAEGTDTRQFDSQGFVYEAQYNKTGTIVKTDTGNIKFQAAGKTSQINVSLDNKPNEPWVLIGNLSTPAETCGYYTFSSDQTSQTCVRTCVATSMVDIWIKLLFSTLSSDFNDFNKDDIYNVYWRTWTEKEGKEIWKAAIKFDSSKRLTYIVYDLYRIQAVQEDDVEELMVFPISYTRPTINIPEHYTDNPDTFKTDKSLYHKVNTHVEIDTRNRCGRYLIPNDESLIKWDITKSLTIKFDRPLLGGENVVIHNGERILIQATDYTVSSDFTITINENVLKENTPILMCIGGSTASYSDCNKMIITQDPIEFYQCSASKEFDGYVPVECLGGTKISLKAGTEYVFTIDRFQPELYASLFALITDWKGGQSPEYYDLTLDEVVSVKHNGIDETNKISKEAGEKYIVLNNNKGYDSGTVEITIKLLKDTECIPNFEDA